MDRSSPSPLAGDIAAALDWWREAGVDASFADTPKAWLAEPDAAPSAPATDPKLNGQIAPAPDPRPAIGGDRGAWPATLDAFAPWWLAEPSLDEGNPAQRVAPRGPAKAKLMVLVAMPEESDGEQLLDGPLGALLDGFLAAAGISSEAVYRAAALPRYQPLPDWPEMAQLGMGAVLAHHISLVAPERLLVLGQSILPLCGHDPAQGAQNLRSFNHDDGRVPALAEAGLDRLLAKPQLRARMWRRWLEWTDGDQSDNST